MFILDRMLIGGLRFVLDKIAVAADRELNDPDRLREELLEAQMRLELGEIDEDEFAALEAQILARLRALRPDEAAPGDLHVRVAGVEVSVVADEDAR